jgi:hypothetical protein
VRELRRCRLAWRLPPTRSHGGSQGFKSPHLHPQHRRSERRQRRAGDAHCMSRPRCGRQRTSQSSQKGSQGREATRSLGRTMTTQRGHGQPPTDGAILARIPPLPVGLAHCPTTAHEDGQVEATRRWLSTTCASFEGQAPTSGRRRAVVASAGDHADPAIPAVRLPAPPPHPTTSFPSDTTDAGGRTLDTWTPGHSDARTGHRSLGQAPRDTGRSHRTPDRNADTVTTAQPASGPPWPPRRATAR